MSFFPTDDELPTWLHTTLLLGVISVFALPIGWEGIDAIARRRYDSTDGPEFGIHWFDPPPFEGGLAVTAGFAQLTLMLTIYVFAMVYASRWHERLRKWRAMPWILSAAYFAACVLIDRSRRR
jgi:hypothetical protein